MERVGVEPCDGVTRHDDVRSVPLDLLGHIGAALLRRLGEHLHLQLGRELRGLARPYAQHRRRCDDECGRRVEFACGAGAFEHREGLDRLAEPHVVGEHAAEPRVPQVGEPGVSLELVGAQGRPERRGQLDALRVPPRPRQPLDGRLPLGALRLDDAEPDELIPQPDVIATDLQAVVLLVGELLRFLEHLGDVEQLR